MQAISLQTAFVKVKLTSDGEKIFTDHVAQLNMLPGVNLDQTPPTKNPEGFSEFKLSEFMEIFGKHLSIQKPPVMADPMMYLYER